VLRVEKQGFMAIWRGDETAKSPLSAHVALLAPTSDAATMISSRICQDPPLNFAACLLGVAPQVIALHREKGLKRFRSSSFISTTSSFDFFYRFTA
jgi:hypothetical protein